ncbi:MAG TPA: type III secretion system cytoplasmic ring protein SctQ [Anaeromyxobacteraceae bacterium]|nr:type III secretion system cytoplasmic ring protein SctQ [Anaeromyxobacteraceae bacterium]
MALPFDLPTLSRGYAELGRGSRAVGARAAEGAARALSHLLGCPVAIEGRALPGSDGGGLGCGQLGIALGAIPSAGALEVEAGLVARLVDRLAGGPGESAAATALTPLEQSALELFALAALEGACRAAPEIDERAAPRLARTAGGSRSPLLVDVRITFGEASGRALLRLPPEAVRALGGATLVGDLPAGLCATASLRSGWTRLEPEEIDALAFGDVVLLDQPPGGRHVLAFPGGLRAAGRLEDDSLHVEETSVADQRTQIPVTLEVELARFPVPLADLARLETGAVLPLPVDRRGLVVLRAGDHAIARGELVDVDGSVGVRILSLEGQP